MGGVRLKSETASRYYREIGCNTRRVYEALTGAKIEVLSLTKKRGGQNRRIRKKHQQAQQVDNGG